MDACGQDTQSEPGTVGTSRPDVALRGRGLRFVLVDELRQRRTMTVAEMVKVMAESGFDLGGRASKVISDALRWELARGRVIRLERGLYRYHKAPASTIRRIRLFATRCRAWAVATTRMLTPPPTPPNRRATPWLKQVGRGQDPNRPPWEHLGWLWAT